MTTFIRSLAAALASLAFLFAAPAQATSEWDGVSRVVVIGDLEGDYEKFVDMLRSAGLVNSRNSWSGGEAHLVQLGDIPDRGPHSRMIMDLLIRLEPQARRAGGRVHALIGNHEAMNVEGDLRYVHPGEYAAFADRQSERRRQEYYQRTIEHLRANPPPGGVPEFNDAFRAQWERDHPLGYVEHRLAWAPTGRYGRWIAEHNSVIRINDTLFLHAGLGPSFLQAGRDDMNAAVSAALHGQPSPNFSDILVNQEGPLWYRGLSLHEEAAESAHLQALLTRHNVARIVVGHTKRASTVLPRFGGRVIITDIAVPRGHSDPHAYLIIEGGQLTTMHRGQRVPLDASSPQALCSYLDRIAALDGDTGPVATLEEQSCSSAQMPALVQ